MHARQFDTELRLQSALPQAITIRLFAAGAILATYLIRCAIQDIPPQDHVALSLLICCLLTSAWSSLEQTQVTISLAHNRCWMTRRRMGRAVNQSIPVSQIHSAKPELCPDPGPGGKEAARIVLITSLGVIPVCERYTHDPLSTRSACEKINRFLASEAQYMAA